MAVPVTGPDGARAAELDVVDVVEETREARSLVLRVPPELSAAFGYRPGQFLTLRIPSERTGSVARSYSLASDPGADPHLKVTVKRTAGGYGSNWLCDNVRIGDRVTVLPPAGAFALRRLDADLLLFAAGSGITPVISILKAALREGSRQVVLCYANRDRASVIFDPELSALQERYAGRLTVHHWLDEEQRHPDADRVAAVARPWPAADAYLCGPAPFMSTVAEGLRAAGLAREQVHREVFASLSGDPFGVPAPTEAPAAGAAGSTRGVVHLDGATHEVAWPAEQTLVDVLLARGIDVPYSCRSGECGSCAARLVDGEVAMASGTALDQEDIDDGYLLGCQARPVSAVVEIAF
ncbi:2Fe-2S iron-sulfur cluster-binding protein [Pimelobacter simplex]|uniref:2Fe-2S iron-sulfur cluster-binding protein n=1 Tax=Nocardioides simplex TaxID=2045 RepID=UPI003AADF96E